MSIIRVRKDARYFTASNELFVDKRLSWETRGLMGYLLTKPDNWEIRMQDLDKQGPAGLYKLRRMLSEARLYGYMNRIRITLPDGTFDWITEVFESPSQNPHPTTSIRKSTTGQARVGLSTSGSATSGSATSGKPTDIISTNEISTEEIKEQVPAPNIFKIYEKNIGVITQAVSEKMIQAEMEFPVEWIIEAIEIAALQNKRNWAYCDAILKRWQADGKDSGKKKPVEKVSEYETL